MVLVIFDMYFENIIMLLSFDLGDGKISNFVYFVVVVVVTLTLFRFFVDNINNLIALNLFGIVFFLTHVHLLRYTKMFQCIDIDI